MTNPANSSKAHSQRQQPLLAVEQLEVNYRSGLSRKTTRALQGVSLRIHTGERLGMAGESGSGKSTLARALVGLITPQTGRVLIDGVALQDMSRSQLKQARRRVQLVFQDPGGALSPRRTIGQSLREPIRLFELASDTDTPALISQALADVGLPETCVSRFPHQFSSGQRQRIAIARALICQPELLIADEAVAALDVSIQAQIINLLQTLHKKRGIAVLFISHDLAVVRQVADRVVIMYQGRIIEQANTQDIYSAPAHPYTRALLAAARGGLAQQPIAAFNGISRQRTVTGCAYHPHCAEAMEHCASAQPQQRSPSGTSDHAVECHLYPKDEPSNV